MWCPEISGDFLVCVLGSCVWFGCCFVSGAGAMTFFSFIFLVDLKHGAICQTILKCSLATISELWVNVLLLLHHGCCSMLQYIKLEIHSGPNLLGNSKAYISSVFKRCRFCSSTVLWGQWNLCLFHNEIIKHLAHILRALFLKGHIMYIQ
jgi:hypothetical protein